MFYQNILVLRVDTRKNKKERNKQGVQLQHDAE